MSKSKKDQKPSTNNVQEGMENASNDQMIGNEEATAQNDGFRYDYDDSSDL
ncbi:hypothetical protein [Alkalihalobacterium elongatum]|uniref:hypothetical protein n=1 Tax=Alkalihalobacterium elongatum TaxID=2675466 RepID=UPI001C1F993C|nr:hypothetical protein [Alkalihalobacterium elongatum]